LLPLPAALVEMQSGFKQVMREIRTFVQQNDAALNTYAP
jgi:hypothetical protein